MNSQVNNPNGIPGHGPSTQVSDPSAGRTDPRGIGTSGQDRDLLGANASALSRPPGAGPVSGKPQSEFGAFLDDLSQLLRSQGSSPSAGSSVSGGQGSSAGTGSDLRSELERRVAQARDKMSGALGSAQDAGAAVTDRMRRGLDQSSDLLAERPLQAVTIAAAVGLLVGLLLADRR